MTDVLKNPDDIIDAMLASGALGDGGTANLETGRQIVTFQEGAVPQGLRGLSGVRKGAIARSSDFANQDLPTEDVSTAAAVVLDELGVAILDEEAGAATAEAYAPAAAGNEKGILSVEPEILMFPAAQAVDLYLRGFAAATARIREDLAGGDLAEEMPLDEDEAAAEMFGATWGVQAVRAHTSRYLGKRIKVAVLDTGIDFRHPDFSSRVAAQSSFISGQTVQDGNGHGTHCAGTAAGPRSPAGTIPRYGCASEAHLFIGKVLSDLGGGTSGTVLAGMNWAVANRCEVISMSLGGRGGPFAYYTAAGNRALAAGCLIIAAAGNDSNRPATIIACSAPANSPSALAVAALEPGLRVARYSNGGPIDLAAPGSDVLSSLPVPRRYGILSGTSMATPHVAGCAAMLAQANRAFRGRTLWIQLQEMSRRLNLPPRDAGVGLVQAVQ